MAAPTPASAPEFAIPSEKTLAHAAALAIEKDMPILLDYFVDTREGTAFLGEDPVTSDKMLVRSEDEYTSLVQKIVRVKDAVDLIVITENSIYVISGNIKKRKISSPVGASA
jgi:hypothetical protein